MELRAMREATIDKVAKKLLDDVDKKREREKISNELYQEEQILKWAEEPAKLVSRKQRAIAESLKEMARSLTEFLFEMKEAKKTQRFLLTYFSFVISDV